MASRCLIHLDQVIDLLNQGMTLDEAAQHFGVVTDSVTSAARRRGTREQKARIALARPYRRRDGSRISAALRRIHLDEVIYLLGWMDIDEVASRLGVTADAIADAARKRGTPDERARIALARRVLADEKRQAARELLAERAEWLPRDTAGRFKAA